MEEQLQDQLAFLERSCAAFDDGYTDEYKRLAVSVRVLVHDAGQSHSLLGQLGMKGGHFISYTEVIDGRNMMADWPLAIMSMGGGGITLLPKLDKSPFPRRMLTFENWWTETVYRDPHSGVSLDRKTIVLTVANQDGGAHVDPEIDQRYARLVEIGTGLLAGVPPHGIKVEDLEKVSLRHIAFELIKSIQPEIAKRLGNRGCSCGSGRKHRYCCGKSR
ncbi:hypothetical protein MOP88_10075 [Sphingomonas sp. WKB10]|nr:hypothetical protein [Sphingomonas sp. WKB10]